VSSELDLHGGRRVGDRERQDVIHHLIACGTSGHLEHEEAERRMSAATDAVRKEELYRLVKDLPDQRELAAMKQRRSVAGKERWLTSTRHGRVVLHLSLGVLSFMLIIVPVIVSTNDGWKGPGAVALVVACVLGGLASLVGDVAFAALWKGWE
jgi:hypothetical protein